MMRIELEAVDLADALKKARSAVKKAKASWIACHIFVTLPERGRYLIKYSGRTQFMAGG